MRFYKRIMGIMIAVILTFHLCGYSILADELVTDGGSGDMAAAPEDIQPTFEPKIMVESYTFSKKTIYAGDKVTVNITFVNTSGTSAVKNMMVTAGIENEYMQLTSKTDSVYIPFISAGGRYNVSFQFKTKADTPPGQYDLSLSMDYADKDGGTYSASGKVKVNVGQKTKVKFDSLIINSEAEIGDTIEAQVNAMNLGHGTVRNVRAVIKADGLTPKGTLYIGDIEAGQMGTGTVEIAVGGMTDGDELYGDTSGTVIYYYESAAGKKYKLKKNFTLTIKPLSVTEHQEEADDTSQWWISIGVIAAIIGVLILAAIIRLIQRKSEAKHEMD